MEHPEQACGGILPWSHVSGNSTAPLPHTGHGMRQGGIVGPSFGQVVNATMTGVGFTPLPWTVGFFRAGNRKRLMPGVPGGIEFDASSVPCTVSCSRAV